jgi:hypothetical protein
VEQDATLDGGEVKTIALAFKRTPATSQASEVVVPAAAPPAHAMQPEHTLRTASYVAGAAGAAGLALFAVTGLMAKSAFDKLGEDCGAGPCPNPSHQADIDRGKSLQTVANVSLVFGAVACSVGGTLFVLGMSQNQSRGPAVSFSDKGGVVSYSGTF